MGILSKFTDEQVHYQLKKVRGSSSFLFPFYFLWMIWVMHRSEMGSDAAYEVWEKQTRDNLKEYQELAALIRRKVEDTEKMVNTKINWHTSIAERDGTKYEPDKNVKEIRKLIKKVNKSLDIVVTDVNRQKNLLDDLEK